MTFTYPRGIDTSTYSGKTDFVKMKSTGITFVIPKCSDVSFWRQPYTDNQFKATWSGAKAAGLARGAYHWLSPSIDPLKQAQYFVTQFGGDFGELPPVVDYETQRPFMPQWKDAGRARNYLKQFLEEVYRLTRIKSMIYTGAPYWKAFGSSDPYWAQYPLWIAQYTNDHKTPLPQGPTIPRPWTSWALWQYADKGDEFKHDGKYFGQTGLDVDMNFYNPASGLLPTVPLDSPPAPQEPPIVVNPPVIPPATPPNGGNLYYVDWTKWSALHDNMKRPPNLGPLTQYFSSTPKKGDNQLLLAQPMQDWIHGFNPGAAWDKFTAPNVGPTKGINGKGLMIFLMLGYPCRPTARHINYVRVSKIVHGVDGTDWGLIESISPDHIPGPEVIPDNPATSHLFHVMYDGLGQELPYTATIPLLGRSVWCPMAALTKV